MLNQVLLAVIFPLEMEPFLPTKYSCAPAHGNRKVHQRLPERQKREREREKESVTLGMVEFLGLSAFSFLEDAEASCGVRVAHA